MQAPTWLDRLRERIAGAFQRPELVIVKARWHDDDEEEPHWRVVAYPAVTEIVGGRNDGECVYPRLLLDVEAMSRMFDEKWGMRLDGGCAGLMPPALDLWGLFHGERVHVRVLLAPPEDAEPLELLDAHTGVVV